MAIPIDGVFTNLSLQLLLDDLLNRDLLSDRICGPELRLLTHVGDKRLGARDLPFFVLHPEGEAADSEHECRYTGRYDEIWIQSLLP